MQADELFRRYQDLQQYVGWSPADAARIRAAGTAIESQFPALIADFYAAIERHPDARRVITGGAEQIERLKATLSQWLSEIFHGEYDADYVSRRWRIGFRHGTIGLEAVYANAALSRLRIGLLDCLDAAWSGSIGDLLAVRRSLNRVLDLDLAIIEWAYHAAFFQRQQRTERLAAIGQTMTGLAHESRNALQRSRSCLELLALEVHDRPEALELVARTLRAQKHLELLYEEVRQYAAPLMLKQERVDLARLWREVWADVVRVRNDKNLRLREELALADLNCEVDRFAIGRVFRNILENSFDAAPDNSEITVGCAETMQPGGAALLVAFRDQGPGMTAEQRSRVFEPFFTTKTKGTGLGMAIAQRIVETHRGQIAIGEPNGGGTEIIITLPRGNI